MKQIMSYNLRLQDLQSHVTPGMGRLHQFCFIL